MNNIQFKCPKCGNQEFKVPRKDLRDTDKMKCAKCGFTDTAARIVGPQAQKFAEDALKKTFKGLR